MSADDEAFIAKTLAALDAGADERRNAALEAVAEDLRRPTPADHAFIDRVTASIDQRHQVAREAALDGVLAEVAPIRRAPPRSRWLTRQVLVAAALAATLAAVLTWFTARPGPPDVPFAFGGDPAAVPTPDIERDARGRIATIGHLRDGQPEGERLIFRAGKLIRIEHWRNGALDGVSIDFDAQGRLVRSRTFVEGAPRGPWVEFAEDGRVHDSGD